MRIVFRQPGRGPGRDRVLAIRLLPTPSACDNRGRKYALRLCHVVAARGDARPPQLPRPIASPSSSALNWTGPAFDLSQPIFAEAYAGPRLGGSLALPTTDSTTSAALLALKGRSGASPYQLTPSHRRPGRYRRTNPPECSARESPGHLQAAIRRLRKAARLSVCKAAVSPACPANCSR